MKAAVLSDLQSPDENPHGYLVAAAAASAAAILLAPVAWVSYRYLRKPHPCLALAGAAGFAVGLASAMATGVLAPFTHGHTPLHIQLASAAFLGITAGTWLHLLAARAGRALILFQLVALLAVIDLFYGPVDFRNDRLLTGLAFWERMLCVDCAAALGALARKIERNVVLK